MRNVSRLALTLLAALPLAACHAHPPGPDPSHIRHESDKTWLTNVHGFDAGQYASSVHGAQAVVAQSLHLPIDYVDLLGYSGLAFRVQVRKQMCPSAAHPGPGYTCWENSVRAFPWRIKVFDAAPWGKGPEDRAAFEAEAVAAIKDSIDRGVPVQYGSEEDGLIIGYADSGKRWLCVHPYYKMGRETFWHDQVSGFAGGKWPWFIHVYTTPRLPADTHSRRELAVIALRYAVDMWKGPEKNGYLSGDAAYEHWLNWLATVDSRPADSQEIQGNGWCFATLPHYRRAAAEFLVRIAPEFPAARPHLQLAADHYTQLANICTKDLPSTWDLAPPSDRAAEWSPLKRREQAARLALARVHDRAAIRKIQAALAVIPEMPTTEPAAAR